ncbi:MAG: hypothetical protein J0L51_12530 [Rhizobiales bacterium]|nr:hypothetical protein [Hyphomicrobiales bacterium]
MTDEKPRRTRSFLSGLSLPIISLLIASLSLMASISQSYNYRRNIESVQQNVLRAENLKTCREIIEVFFAFRLRAEEANARGREVAADLQASTRRELKSLVYRFGAIGTHLANFAPDAARERYSRLSWMLNDVAEKAMGLSLAEFDTRFSEIDTAFATLNEDCVKATKLHS